MKFKIKHYHYDGPIFENVRDAEEYIVQASSFGSYCDVSHWTIESVPNEFTRFIYDVVLTNNSGSIYLDTFDTLADAEEYLNNAVENEKPNACTFQIQMIEREP